jgi:hypothetical protein
MRACRVMEVKIHAFFTSSPNRSELIFGIIGNVTIIFLYNVKRPIFLMETDFLL